MAPEQVRGSQGEITAEADVYALGVILYELLTGRAPFPHDRNQHELHKLILDEKPEKPSRLAADIDADLEAICLKCLEKEKERRYPSAAHLADDLRRWQAGEPIQARLVGYAEWVKKWVRRNRIVSALIAAVVVALVGGMIGTCTKYLDAKEQEGIANARSAELRDEVAAKEKALAAESAALELSGQSGRWQKGPA